MNFSGVIIIDSIYLLYIIVAIYKGFGNEKVNILLLASTLLFIIIYCFACNPKTNEQQLNMKARITYKWIKRFIHLINALYIIVSIVFYHMIATPLTIIFKYFTIVNFIVQSLAALFRYILKNKYKSQNI